MACFCHCRRAKSEDGGRNNHDVVSKPPELSVHIKRTFASVHQGTTADGKTFQTFLGNDKFDKKIVSKFDEFLREAFGKHLSQRRFGGFRR